MKTKNRVLSVLLTLLMTAIFMSGVPSNVYADNSYSATFKYNGKTYTEESITGSKEIQLTTILTPLEITGTVTAASVSEDQGMTVTTTALTLTQAFGSGWLKVTVNGTEYHIVIESSPDTIGVAYYGTLFFDKNGGSGEMNAVSVREYSNYTLPACGYTAPDGCEFSKWEINGTQYSVGDTYFFGHTTTAKAIWKLRAGVHDISASYESNNGDVVITPTKAAQGETVTVTVQPIAGKAINSITYSHGSTSGQPLSGVNGGIYTFSMPNENTTVSVTFKDAAITPIPYVDGNGSNQTCNYYRYVRSNDTSWSGWVVASQNLTLDSRVTVSGTVNLILMDGKTLTVTNGIQVSAGATLNIYSQSGNTGALIAGNKQNSYAAGIGGNKGSYNAGTIIITGGQITATGGYSSAGIGGSSEHYPYLGNAGTIKICGNANVDATGGEYGSGIGCGSGGIGGSITIDGNATVQAKALEGYSGSGAAIGSGRGGYVNSITISGGTVIATGANMGSAIGNGNSNSGGDGGTINITGGDVTAVATGSWGAGIGGLCKSITIGGDAVVHASGGNRGAGIGGYYQKAVGNITIEGNANVTATGGASGAGIGTGSEATGEAVITIKGGTVNASMSASNGAAAIGSGYKSEGKTTVSISGGQVTAAGSSIYGVGIGGGNSGASGEEVVVNITGGTVNASGRAGIGTANASNAKQTINISGGTVTARGAIDGSNKCAAIGQGNNSNSVTEINITGGIVRALGTGTGIGSGTNSKQTPAIKLGYTDETKNNMEITAIDYNGTVTLNNNFKYQDGTGAVTAPITANKTIVPSDSTAHTHSFTYSVDGKTITATCANSDNQCNLSEHKATLTIGEPDGKTSMAYDGSAKAAVLTGDTDVLTADMVYKKGDTVLPAAPSDAGSYTASISLGEATATVSYKITKKTVTFASITAKDKAYDGTTKASCTIGTGLNGAVSGDNVYAYVYTGNATFEDANVGVNKKVTFSNWRIEGTAKGNYELIQPEPQYRAITPRVITITAKGQTVAQGGTVVSVPEQVDVTSGTLVTGHSISEITLTGDTSSVTTSGIITPSAVKIVDSSSNDVTANYLVNYTAGTLIVTEAPAHTHSFTYAANGATITATCSAASCPLVNSQATLTIAAPDGSPIYYDGTAKAATVTGDTAVLGTPDITYTKVGAAFTGTPMDAGTYTASITLGTGDGAATAHVVYGIAPATLTNVTVAQNGTLTYAGAAQTPQVTTTATAVNNQTVTFTYSKTENGTFGEMPTVTNVSDSGTFYYKASAPNHEVATGSFTVTVSPASVTITAKNQSIYVRDTVPDLSNPVLNTHYSVEGLLGGDTLTAAPALAYQTSGAAATPDNATPGIYDIVASGASAGGNYSINYTKGTLTIKQKNTQTITAENVTATYGDTDKSVSASVTDPTTGGGAISYAVKSGSENYIEVNASTGALTIKAVPPTDGKAYVVVTAAETATYNQATKEVTVTIAKATNPATVNSAATVMRDGHTVDLANNVTKNGAGGDVSYQISGEANGCSLSGSTLTSGSSTGRVTVNVTVAADDNYEALAATSITVTITDKQTQTITAADVTATYGDTDKSVSATTTGDGAISYAVKSGSENYIDIASDGKLTIKAVPADGKAYVTITAAETATYAQTTKEVTVTISKAGGPAAPTGLAGVAPTTDGGSDGKITGVTTDMEYSADGTSYTACTGTEITGLTERTYYVRVKETATHEAGAAASVTVPAYAAPTYDVTITAGAGMTKTDASGAAKQTGLISSMTAVVYTANEGYYFPTGYSVAEVNGIGVTRNSFTQITVSGTPTGNVEITLADATAKTKPEAPTTPTASNCTTAANDDGKIIGVTTEMEFRKSDATTWTEGTGADITGLAPGTYYVRFKATDTTLASDNQELTIAAYVAPDQVAAPTFDPPAGTYMATQNVAISCTTADATIHYATDGSTPTAASTVYSRPISVSATTTIKAIAVKNGMIDSAVTEATYTVTAASTYTLTVTAPTFDAVNEGYVQPAAKPLTITSAGNSDATITGVSLSGANPSSFALMNGTATVTAGQTNTTYTLQPAANLAAGTYTATVIIAYNGGATATANVSFTVNPASAVQEATPNAVFTATGKDTGTLIGLIDGAEYILTGAIPTSFTASGTTQALTNISPGTLTLVKKGNGTTTVNSNLQSITVTKAATPTNPSAVNCTTPANNDGKLIGVMAGMEYKKSDADTWTDVTGSEVTGLVPGAYYIRVKAAGTALASDHQDLNISAYTAPGQVAAPVFSPSAGTYTEAQTVTITCATEKAAIYYTTNGDTPTTGSTQYAAPIPVSATTTIKAIAVKDGMTNSSVTEAVFTITVLKNYTVKVTNDGHGTGAASPESGKTGTEVTLTAKPDAGYQFKEWSVISGGVTVTNNRFTIGTANVEIKAVFEAEATGWHKGEAQIQPGAPELQSSNMQEVAESVIAAIQNGEIEGISEEVRQTVSQPDARVLLQLIISPLSQDQIPAEDWAALQKLQEEAGYTGIVPFDMTLVLKVNDQTVAEVHETKIPVKFSVGIMEELLGTPRQFALVNVHNGAAKVIPTTRRGNYLDGESTEFSTYAIAYQDEEVRPIDPTKFDDVAVPSDSFTFKKVWQGDSEKSIDFTLYKQGGTVYHHGFDKKIVSKTEWRYNAWFSEEAACYVIEQPIPGYQTKYVNVGVYAQVTDRCCDGGTIINKKIPKTGDSAPLALWAGMILLGTLGLTTALVIGKKRKARK